jgi:hypothetical protein
MSLQKKKQIELSEKYISFTSIQNVNLLKVSKTQHRSSTYLLVNYETAALTETRYPQQLHKDLQIPPTFHF